MALGWPKAGRQPSEEPLGDEAGRRPKQYSCVRLRSSSSQGDPLHRLHDYLSDETTTDRGCPHGCLRCGAVSSPAARIDELKAKIRYHNKRYYEDAEPEIPDAE